MGAVDVLLFLEELELVDPGRRDPVELLLEFRERQARPRAGRLEETSTISPNSIPTSFFLPSERGLRRLLPQPIAKRTEAASGSSAAAKKNRMRADTQVEEHVARRAASFETARCSGLPLSMTAYPS